MNYIKIQIVLVLVLGTDLPHRLHWPDVSPASKILYSYSLAISTGIYSLLSEISWIHDEIVSLDVELLTESRHDIPHDI